jgi:hypothetical protein
MKNVSIELVDPASGKNLVAGGIPIAQLDTSRAIGSLIAELKSQLVSSPQAPVRSIA